MGQNKATDLLSSQPFSSVEVEHLCDFKVPLATDPENFQVPAGARKVTTFNQGTVQGPYLNGDILPGSLIVGLWTPDEVGRNKSIFTICTSDGARILVTGTGRLNKPTPQIKERLNKGEPIGWDEFEHWSTLFFETSAEPYTWLNAIVAIAKAEVTEAYFAVRIYRLK